MERHARGRVLGTVAGIAATGYAALVLLYNAIVSSAFGISFVGGVAAREVWLLVLMLVAGGATLYAARASRPGLLLACGALFLLAPLALAAWMALAGPYSPQWPTLLEMLAAYAWPAALALPAAALLRSPQNQAGA